MQRKWHLRAGPDLIIIIPGRDLYPLEAATVEAPLLIAQLDRWLSAPETQRTIIELYQFLQGRALGSLSQAQIKDLRHVIKARLEEAFSKRELIALPTAPRLQTAQVLREDEEEKKKSPPTPSTPPKRQKTWIEIELLDEEGRPAAKQQYRIELPDGSIEEDFLDKNGRARLDGINPGTCRVSFPNLKPNTPHRA